MKTVIHRLKSTKQQVFPVPSCALAGHAGEKWPSTHERCLIPNPAGRNHIQIIRKAKLETLEV